MRLRQRTESHLRQTPDGLLLLASRTTDSALPQFPPMAFVHGDAVLQEVPLGPVGVLYTYSVVHPGRDKPPYGLAMVDFEPGVRVFGALRFEPGAEPALGAAMRIVQQALPDGEADYAFEALTSAAA